MILLLRGRCQQEIALGMGYHPVPDPSANIDGSQDGMSMLRDMFGGLEEYGNLPDEDKPRFRDFMQGKQMERGQNATFAIHVLACDSIWINK